MCGRFTRYHSWREIHRLYRLTLPAETGRNDEPAYNVAPTQTVPFVTAGEDGNHRLREGMWWLVPYWAKEKPKYAMFNARSEDAETKPAFRDAFKVKRCLVPADGFYEWTKGEDGGKDPWHIHLPGNAPFSFAGLWAYNSALDVTSCTILTMAADEPMRQLHDRQPVILAPAVYDAWLDPATSVEEAKAMLTANLDGALTFYRVGREVNTFKTQGGQCIEPLNPL
jgi:putative SOS response-associated peptidase YedK